MNCDPNTLLDAARCFRCIPGGLMTAVQTQLLCSWATAGEECDLVPFFNWTPPEADPGWTDKNGVGGIDPNHQGDLAFFLANADLPTVTALDFSLAVAASITSLTCTSCVLKQVIAGGGGALGSVNFNCPALEELALDTNVLTVVDFLLCPELKILGLAANPLIAADLSANTKLLSLGIPLLAGLDLSHQPLLTGLSLTTGPSNVFPDLSSNTNLVELICSGCNLNAINLLPLVNLRRLDVSLNFLQTVDISNNPLLGVPPTDIWFDQNNLTQAGVDAILAQFVAHGYSSTGGIHLEGVGNSTPSAAGLADIAILAGRGWTVNYNP